MRRLEQQLSHVSRRQFLRATSAVGGGLLIGFHVPGSLAQDAPAGKNPFEGYLRIGTDNRVTVLCAHMEGGQGIYTGIATLVAEELDADWSQLGFEGAAGNVPYYGNVAMGGSLQLTGGSTAMLSSWERYRQAGAVARSMLIEAAAQTWGVPAGEISVSNGVIRHDSGRSGGFGEFASRAASLTPPTDVQLKSPDQWKYIGDEKLRRPDTPPKTSGKQDYTIDVQLPGMLTAVLKRPPRFGGTVKSFDAEPIKRMAGVVDVVETPRGVAVVAESYWQALKGRDALDVEWDEFGAEKRSSGALMTEYRAHAERDDGARVQVTGDTGAAMASAEKTVTADFEFPYLAHAAMEPLNAVARFENGTLEIWAGHQMPDHYQQTAADIMGLPLERVKLHVMMTGGFFGRRATPDADVIVEAVSIVKTLGEGVPVKVQWSREDDMTGGRYRPMYFHRVQAGIDETGKPTAWKHQIVGQSILAGTVFEQFLVSDGVDATSVEGAADMPYTIPNLDVSLVTPDVGVPVLWWRSVGHTHTAFAVETVLDDLAALAGQDPVEYRRKLLPADARELGVLDLAVEKAGWSAPLAKNRGRGVAVHKSFGSYVAQVAEVSVDNGRWKLERVVCAVDCGVAVNPDIVKAQMEGGIGFALAGLLHGRISLDDGRVEQTNYDTYPVLRINEMPEVEVHILASEESPSGVGEPGVPPLSPAVSNALFAATGQRLRTQPLGTQVEPV